MARTATQARTQRAVARCKTKAQAVSAKSKPILKKLVPMKSALDFPLTYASVMIHVEMPGGRPYHMIKKSNLTRTDGEALFFAQGLVARCAAEILFKKKANKFWKDLHTSENVDYVEIGRRLLREIADEWPGIEVTSITNIVYIQANGDVENVDAHVGQDFNVD